MTETHPCFAYPAGRDDWWLTGCLLCPEPPVLVAGVVEITRWRQKHNEGRQP